MAALSKEDVGQLSPLPCLGRLTQCPRSGAAALGQGLAMTASEGWSLSKELGSMAPKAWGQGRDLD